MRIAPSDNLTNQNNSTNFKALRISPELKKWPSEVLEAVNKSKTIQGIIKNDAKEGQDTIMKYNPYYHNTYIPPIEGLSGGYSSTYYYKSMLDIESPTRNINLGHEYIYKHRSSADIGLADEIKNLDNKKNLIDNFKKNVGTTIEVIKEEPKPEPVKEKKGFFSRLFG